MEYTSPLKKPLTVWIIAESLKLQDGLVLGRLYDELRKLKLKEKGEAISTTRQHKIAQKIMETYSLLDLRDIINYSPALSRAGRLHFQLTQASLADRRNASGGPLANR